MGSINTLGKRDKKHDTARKQDLLPTPLLTTQTHIAEWQLIVKHVSCEALKRQSTVAARDDMLNDLGSLDEDSVCRGLLRKNGSKQRPSASTHIHNCRPLWHFNMLDNAFVVLPGVAFERPGHQGDKRIVV